MDPIRQAEKPYLRSDMPALAVGDTVDVAVKITEADRERVQVFTGTVISVRGAGLGRTFTVRRIVQGEGVERVFPLHSPVLESVTVTRKGRVRRAKLYYLRDRVGKATRLREVVGGARPRKTRGVQVVGETDAVAPEDGADTGAPPESDRAVGATVS
jgi:large subunit ribosomal protein L19